MPLEDLETVLKAEAAVVHAGQRVRRVASGSATLPEVRFLFELDADSEDQAMVRAAAVVAAITGSYFEPAQWAYRVRLVG